MILERFFYLSSVDDFIFDPYGASSLTECDAHAVAYHEVSALRLHLATTSGLVAAGIPAEALGFLRGKKQVISSCFKFSDFARELMLASLGGTCEGTASRIGPIFFGFPERRRGLALRFCFRPALAADSHSHL